MSSSNRYSAGDKLFSSRCSEIFLGEDLEAKGRALLLVRSRFPVDAENSGYLDERIEQVSSHSNLLPTVELAGLDVHSHFYVILESKSRTPICEYNTRDSVKEKLFIKIVEDAARLHQAEIVVGDICSESYLVGYGDIVHLIGVLGVFDSIAKKTAMLPPKEVLYYLPPEPSAHGTPTKQSDVFALGALGYKLFAGEFAAKNITGGNIPEDISSFALAPSSQNLNVPFWLDDVLGTAMRGPLGERFADAGEMLKVIKEAQSTGSPPGGLSRWSQKALVVQPRKKQESKTDSAARSDLVKEAAGKASNEVEDSLDKSAARRSKPRGKFLPIAMILGLVSTVALFLFSDLSGPVSEIELGLKMDEALTPPELKPALSDLKARGVPVEVKKQALERIAESQDPISFRLLASVMKHSSQPPVAIKARALMLSKLSELEYPNTSKTISRWFAAYDRVQKRPQESGLFNMVIGAADPSARMESRVSSLNNLVEHKMSLGLQVAAALGVDTRGEPGFVDEFRRLLQTKAGVKDIENKRIYSLLLADKKMLPLFEQDIKGFLEEFSHKELAWALDQLAVGSHSLLYDVAGELIKRDIVPRYQAVFLEILSGANPITLPGEMRVALVKGARGELSRNSIAAFGRWYDLQAETALLASCALKPDSEIGTYALQTLAGRSVRSEPARSFVSWAKSSYWEHRKKLAQAIGIIGLIDIATADELQYAINSLIPFGGNRSFFKLIKNTKRTELMIHLVDSVGTSLSSDRLVELLGIEDQEIKIAAIRALKGRNDLGVLQEILQAYKMEKDPEVRKVYEELHWITQNRERDL